MLEKHKIRKAALLVMKKILLLTTGGTIASSDTGSGLMPVAGADRLLNYVPDINKICNLYTMSVMNIDSTNMTPELMMKLAQAVSDNYDKYDGFAITHGTDTMAYSAAALSYMLQNLGKPVVFTGSQLPIEAEGTDAINNLSDAIHFACENICGVYVVFNGIAII